MRKLISIVGVMLALVAFTANGTLPMASGPKLFVEAGEVSDPAVGNSGSVFQFVGGDQSTAPTNSFDTSNGVMVVFVGRQKISEFATGVVSDNQGNTYTMGGTAHDYAPLWPTSGTAYYYSLNAIGGTGTIVSDSKPSDGDEITVMALNVINADQIESANFVYDTTGPTTTCTSITVTKPSVLVSMWSGDDDDGELDPQPGSGWTRRQFTNSMAGNHIQMAMATKVVEPGTHGNIWTPATSQGGHCHMLGVNLQ